MPGAPSPGDKTPLETFVNDTVSRSLIEYFEDKGDPGKQEFVILRADQKERGLWG